MNWKRFADEKPPDAPGTWIVIWPKDGRTPGLVQREAEFVDAFSSETYAAGWFNDEGLGGDDLAEGCSHWALVTAPTLRALSGERPGVIERLRGRG